ncbi:MAG TPA: response regulator [Cytophagales bacterium]|nr:response regulator [Cytophagales bacterium]
MKQKLNCILLIDDDEPTNFINELVIKKMDCTHKVVSKSGARDALEYLKSQHNGTHPQPDLIFLDINMPAMNGWDFLEEYKTLDDRQKAKIVIVMLTTSLNPDDEERANKIKEINAFKSKPLTKELMEEILNKYFSDKL